MIPLINGHIPQPMSHLLVRYSYHPMIPSRGPTFDLFRGYHPLQYVTIPSSALILPCFMPIPASIDPRPCSPVTCSSPSCHSPKLGVTTSGSFSRPWRRRWLFLCRPSWASWEKDRLKCAVHSSHVFVTCLNHLHIPRCT